VVDGPCAKVQPRTKTWGDGPKPRTRGKPSFPKITRHGGHEWREKTVKGQKGRGEKGKVRHCQRLRGVGLKVPRVQGTGAYDEREITEPFLFSVGEEEKTVVERDKEY